MSIRGHKRKTSTRDGSRKASAAPSRNLQTEKPKRDGEPYNQVVAAYECGRLLNQLDWHIQQAWLLPALDWKEARQHSHDVSNILTNLTPTLRPALCVEAEERLHDILLARRDEWEGLFASPRHVDDIDNEVAFIQHELAQDVDRSVFLLLEENWLLVLRSVEGFAPAAFQSVLAELDERCQRALQLGRWIDRGLHPRAVYRYMCWPRKTSPAVPPPGVDPWSIPDGISPVPQSVNSADEVMPPVLYRVTAGIIPPEQGWMEQLRRFWGEMGLPEPLLESFATLEGEATESPTETGIGSYIRNLDEVVRDELDDITSPGKIPPDERTRPMTMQEAARLMGIGGKRKGAESLRTSINGGTIKCEQITRQRHVFSKRDFPTEVWDQLT